AKGLDGIVLLTLDFFLRCADLLAGAKGSPWLRLRAIGAKRPALWRADWQGGKEACVLAGGLARWPGTIWQDRAGQPYGIGVSSVSRSESQNNELTQVLTTSDAWCYFLETAANRSSLRSSRLPLI